ncbi:ribosome biogenesis GTP-binding protein YsxC [soil metagenome]
MVIRTVEYAGTLVDAKAPYPGDFPQVAFAGRSNVGKSSLINTLLQRTRKKIAHVSSTPGKTQALNFFLVNELFYLVDLPGFGFAKVPVTVKEGWMKLVRGYLARADGPRAVVLLIDIRRGATPDDVGMLAFLAELGVPTLVVLTKADKLAYGARMATIRKIESELGLDPEQVVASSAQTGLGRDTILAALESILEEDPAEAPQLPAEGETAGVLEGETEGVLEGDPEDAP